MSKDNEKKNEFAGETFRRIIEDSMHKGSSAHAVSKLLESFDENQKDQVLSTVKGLSSIVDKLKLLVARTEKEEPSDG